MCAFVREVAFCRVLAELADGICIELLRRKIVLSAAFHLRCKPF